MALQKPFECLISKYKIGLYWILDQLKRSKIIRTFLFLSKRFFLRNILRTKKLAVNKSFFATA